MNGQIYNHIQVLNKVMSFFVYLSNIADERDQFNTEDDQRSFQENKTIF
jgi:hypothetical protein